MASKKKAEPTSRILVLNDGSKFNIIGENDKYYLCEDTQFRKSNPIIVEVIEPRIESEASCDIVSVIDHEE